MLCSLFDNDIGDEGASALAAVLKETQITTLGCAATPRVFAFVSAPIDMVPHSLGSLASNTLCGVDSWGGTYTTEGITKLCEALKASAVTSLECAAAPQSARLCVSHPAPPLARSIGRNKLGDKGTIVLAAGLKETQITTLG